MSRLECVWGTHERDAEQFYFSILMLNVCANWTQMRKFILRVHSQRTRGASAAFLFLKLFSCAVKETRWGNWIQTLNLLTGKIPTRCEDSRKKKPWSNITSAQLNTAVVCHTDSCIILSADKKASGDMCSSWLMSSISSLSRRQSDTQSLLTGGRQVWR